tara:strand:+ start:53 stop:511 length:459 start_codon:yes stop_codon:yes gene_type:complete
MKFLTLIIILSVLLTNCGFKPIYSSKNSNFEIIEIVNKNENKNSFAVEEMVMSVSNESAKRKIKLEFDYKKEIITILKDSKGDPSKNKLFITINLVLKNDKNNILANKTFREEFNFNVQSNKFEMSQYVENISNNLNNKLSDDIIFFITTLE